MTGTQKKRLSALEELLDDDEGEDTRRGGVVATTDGTGADHRSGVEVVEEGGSSSNNDNDGIFGAIAGFYKKADSMAASQALLLNKELEDRGILEKITDETGLKVVGKAAASKQRDGGGSE